MAAAVLACGSCPQTEAFFHSLMNEWRSRYSTIPSFEMTTLEVHPSS